MHLLRQLAPEERTELIETLKVSRATYFRWQNNPGSIPVEEADSIRTYLQGIHGRKYDLMELWSRNPAKKAVRKRVAA